MLAAISLVALIALPAFATSRTRSDRVLCVNNLRQVGEGFLTWANDHEDRPPFEVPASEGGTRSHILAPNTWFHFAWISNELRTAKVLLCPSDTGRPALDFTGNPDSGYLHPNFANRATSYFVSHWWGQSPLTIIAGDRNVRVEGTGSCTPFRTASYVATRPSLGYWSDGLHQAQGNLLMADGRVVQADQDDFGTAINSPEIDGYSTFHVVRPR